MDERKSWNRLILAYSGVGLVVLTIAFFVARSASHSGFMTAHPGSTAESSVVGVYNGIRPDATATPVPTASPSPSPSPSPAGTNSPSPRPTSKASSDAKAADVAAAAAAAVRKRGAKARGKLVADTGATSDGAAPSGESAHIAPISRQQTQPETPAIVRQPEATAAPTAQPTAAPVAAPPAETSNDPIFAPERIVDAQVKVAVQPDESEADRERGAHGTSVVLVTIDPKGNVINAVVATSSGYSTLDRAAVSAARSSQFVAPKINGRPATETYRVVYDFQ